MESIAEMLAAANTSNSSLAKLLFERLEALENMTPEEQEAERRQAMQRTVDRYNATPGHYATGYINSDNNQIPGDGYNCPLCLNRGDTMVLEERNGYLFEKVRECKCMSVRRSIWRMKASGLEKSINEYTFKRFEAKEPWQKRMLEMAKRYIEKGVKEGCWLYFGGQPGCGKTHICTAVCGKLLYKMPIQYVIWPQISKKLKSIVNDAEEYSMEVGKLETIDVLYIDDFFKPVKDDTGQFLPPTPADKKLAFEIINYRYINRMPTILTSEWGIAELTDIDEATGSRIAERCRISDSGNDYSLMVNRDRARNYRLTGMMSV